MCVRRYMKRLICALPHECSSVYETFNIIIYADAKQVEITGLEDKRQITALLSCTMSSDLLPPQLLFQGNITLTSTLH